MPRSTPSYAILAYPYARLRRITLSADELRMHGRNPGSALVWSMGESRADPAHALLLRRRPGGLALVVILSPGTDVLSDARAAAELRNLRPQGVLPFHAEPEAGECAQVLRRPPLDLAADVVDYLRWRGLCLDRDTCHLVRRILDLSGELRSIASVSRSLYLSRRALGRRLTLGGLPVPSHWLQMGRLLRVAVRLQNSEATVSSVAFEHGYPDGFSLSNQMERLLGHRPSEVRRRLGWEWLVEAWLRREAGCGRFSSPIIASADSRRDHDSTPEAAPRGPRRAERGRKNAAEA
jgi:AraC-like DNA-binding protein